MNKDYMLRELIALAKDERNHRNFLITSGLVREHDILSARDCGVRLETLKRIACLFELTDNEGFWELTAGE